MPRRSHRGTPAENAVAAELRRCGYLVASRRHEPGAGDLLACRPGEIPLLVEVKNTTVVPWASAAHFGPGDRQAMLDTARDFVVEPVLAWVIPGLSGVAWIPPEDWPPVRGARPS